MAALPKHRGLTLIGRLQGVLRSRRFSIKPPSPPRQPDALDRRIEIWSLGFLWALVIASLDISPPPGGRALAPPSLWGVFNRYIVTTLANIDQNDFLPV